MLRGRWHGEQFSAGALLTLREERDGDASNRVAGADLEWRPSEDQRWSARAMASRSRDTAAGPGESGHHVRAA